ncbi:hypothetical protein ACJMK2_040333 [Sinanodonta woodiana]|uniref:EGF-like domain-containing protein n=1 Tax=Sinanodonta woodiana TaxID=1069815 RepID=A0ABD3WEP0_SINWO
MKKGARTRASKKHIEQGEYPISLRISEEPTFVPLKPVVYPIEVAKQGATAIYTHVHFVCYFEPSKNDSEADLHYQVFWYTVKNNIETNYIMLEQPKHNLSDLQLTEDIFIKKMNQTLGVEISCVVVALSGPKGVPGVRSDRSDAFFAGIRVNVVKSRIVRGDDKEQGLVTLTSTIPIGCVGKTGCSLPIRAHVPDEYKCKGPAFGNNCGTSIISGKWNNSHNIVIKAADTGEYSLQGTYLVHLKTAKFWTSARIWDDYYLPTFQVQIVDSPTKDWTGKVCYSNNDPHMRTFDGRVRQNENLFDLSQNVKGNLSTWVTYACVCGDKSVDTADAPIPCGGHTTQECHLGYKVGTRACTIINTRRRRSVPTKDRFPAPTDRKRRSTTKQQEESIYMTEKEALTYCQDYMNKSQIYTLCQNVPSTNPDKNVETCAMDILLTNTTVWSESSREVMREQCLNEISRNNTFREVEEASGIVAEIQEKACPSMCSNRGHCVNGACICDAGYGASDCSTNLLEPPDIFGLLDNGLCDEHHVECDHAFVYGETFVEGQNLTCRIKSFTMSYQGDRTFDRTDYVPAEHETLFEVVCPVQKTRRKKRSLPKNIQASDRFVIGYTISVSNDGLNYGKDFDLYMYNSECQLPENTSTTITFKLQDGYCFIDHTCIVRGTINEKDECLICDDKQFDFQWSTRENHAGCRNVPETSTTTLSPKGSSTNLKINFAFLFASTIALRIIFQS